MDENEKNEKPRADGSIEEREVPEERIEGEVKIKLPVSEKLSNFWYHYKWHTIVTAFILIVLTVVTVQFCTREKYDINILYAGDKAISSRSSDGDIPERTKFINSFSSIVPDFDDNGEVSIGFKSLYAPDEEELERLRAEGADTAESLRSEDNETLSSLIASSDYYLLLLDYAVFERLATETVMISSADPYLGNWQNEVVRVGNSSGVYLSDTKFAEYEGLSSLPADTVLCIKHTNAFASKSDEQKREEAIEVFKKIIAM